MAIENYPNVLEYVVFGYFILNVIYCDGELEININNVFLSRGFRETSHTVYEETTYSDQTLLMDLYSQQDIQYPVGSATRHNINCGS